MAIRVHNKRGQTELFIYEDIGSDPFFGGGVGAADVVRALKEAPRSDSILVRINSAGGNVFDGMAIYNTLVQDRRDITTQVDGMAFSAASYIMMAGTTRLMAENAMLMIHEGWGFIAGTADDMRARATMLDEINGNIKDIYADSTGNKLEQIAQWMADETFFTVDPETEEVLDALELGFVTEVIENQKLAASALKFDPARARVQKVPEELKDRVMTRMDTVKAKVASMGKRSLEARRLTQP